MRLYNVAYSGNSYKVRLLLSHLGLPCEIVEVDILKCESRTPEFLRINPNGRTPVLVDDDGFILAESNAILAYLARGKQFLPHEGGFALGDFPKIRAWIERVKAQPGCIPMG